MNLKEILARKTQNHLKPLDIKESFPIEEVVDYNIPFLEITEKTNDEKALLLFLILYYRGNKQGCLYINYGEGARSLYSSLGNPILPYTSYPPIPLGHSITDHYLLVSILGIPENVIYYLMKILIDKKSEACENSNSPIPLT